MTDQTIETLGQRLNRLILNTSNRSGLIRDDAWHLEDAMTFISALLAASKEQDRPVIGYKWVDEYEGDRTPPEYAHEGDAAVDLRAYTLRSDVGRKLYPGERVIVPTGLMIELPPGYEGQVRPRSNACKSGVMVTNSPGTIDSTYRGELKVGLINQGQVAVEIANGDRIAQLVITRVARAEFQPVDELSATERGKGGFGSTGR